MANIQDLLKRAGEIAAERAKFYGEKGHQRHGDIMAALFPDGVTLRTADDFARFLLVEMVVSKLNRYCRNYADGGHEDSALDMGNYSFMLAVEDLDRAEAKKKP